MAGLPTPKGACYWLVESYLIGCFSRFVTNFSEGGGDLRVIFYQSVSAVVNTLIAGGNTEALTFIINCF